VGLYKCETWGAVGEKMNPRNMWILMRYFHVLEMPGFSGFIIGKEYMKERLKPP
jgi:hypothetical protein